MSNGLFVIVFVLGIIAAGMCAGAMWVGGQLLMRCIKHINSRIQEKFTNKTPPSRQEPTL